MSLWIIPKYYFTCDIIFYSYHYSLISRISLSEDNESWDPEVSVTKNSD